MPDRDVGVKMVLHHSSNGDDVSDDQDDEMGPYKPLHLSKPQLVTNNKRWTTPQSSQGQQPSMMPQSPVGSTHKKFSTIVTSPTSPMSNTSHRTSRSEIYFHVYETDGNSLPRAVPPFVVVHHTGHAMVNITPKKGKDFLPENFYDEEQHSTTSSLLSWRSWLRPIVMVIAVGLLILASVTVAAGLISAKEEKSKSSIVPTQAPFVTKTTDFPTVESFVYLGGDNAGGEVVLGPIHELTLTTVSPTQPPRTFPPSNSMESLSTGSPSIAPSTSPASHEEVPWNNYVIGLLAVESPDTFEKLDDPNSPQYKALKWLSIQMSQEGAVAFNQDKVLQLFGLLCFWYATGGMNWKSDGGWLTSDTNECEWEGVTCDNSNIIVALNIIDNGLTGYIPPEIELLKDLQAIVLSHNFMEGSLPLSLVKVSELVDLNLSHNSLVGPLPEQFEGLDLLKTLDVSHNSLTGTIPSTLGNLESLEVLNLCANKFSGTIPSQVGSLFFLRSLNLEGNEALFGIIPDTICDLGSSGSTGNAVLDVLVDCSVECECCTQCCSNNVQPRAMESCCTL
jgi:hypothetical protein